MDPREESLRRIFDLALDLSPAARGPFLDRECGANADLRRRVDAMLAAVVDERFLRSPTRSSELRPASTPVTEGPGTHIGPYKLLQEIGEGGFGVVFLADQESPVKRRVALKVIKLGMDTRQVIARFEAERQALAMMDHPNIARVFDAGTTESGRPYFVMELVKGVPITAYSDQNQLTLRERVELFLPVCNAVQHAHHKGVIHRDLKPGNILVTLHDGVPVPKVIDFGLAKATDHRLTEKTMFTEHGAFLGTPAYMSPEQAELSGLDIDTRTDVYSLGVLLYELMTGSTPFTLEELLRAGYLELQRIIREVEPPKPSTRVTTASGRLSSLAALRKVEARQLGLSLRGDLDWIVMRCLEKQRARRYATAAALADDLRRHVVGQAVEAAPPRMGYRVRKFVRRYRGRVVAVVAAVAILTLGVVGMTWAMLGERAWRIQAEESSAKEKLAASESKTQAEAARLASEQADVARRRAEWQSYVANIAAAAASLDRGETGVARERLAACPTPLRNWEWSYLESSLDQSLRVLPGPGGSIISVTMNPTASRVVGLSNRGVVRLWDASSGAVIADLDANGAPLHAVIQGPRFDSTGSSPFTHGYSDLQKGRILSIQDRLERWCLRSQATAACWHWQGSMAAFRFMRCSLAASEQF